MSEEQKQNVKKALRVAMKAMSEWLNAHLEYQLDYVNKETTPTVPTNDDKGNKEKKTAPKRPATETQKTKTPVAPKKKAKTKTSDAPKKKAKKVSSYNAPYCMGNPLVALACPKKARASDGPSVRHKGKTYEVCDDCRKSVNAFRRKNLSRKKKD